MLIAPAMARKIRDLSDYDMDDALRLMGLRRRRSPAARFFGGLGLVLGGMAVGAVMGILMAPRAGRDLRHGLKSAGGKHGQQPSSGYGAPTVGVGSTSGLS